MSDPNKPLLYQCDGLHQFCNEMTTCNQCSPAVPLRYEDGTFAPLKAFFAKELENEETPKGYWWAKSSETTPEFILKVDGPWAFLHGDSDWYKVKDFILVRKVIP